MRKIQVFHVDAFTDQAFGGNAAGVIPDAEAITPDVNNKPIISVGGKAVPTISGILTF
jgi:hypothetical protein